MPVNLIPTMTSATTPSGIMSASDEYNSDYAAWKAGDKFNEGTELTNMSWHTNVISFPGPWLQYQLSSSKIVNGYSIQARDWASTNSPTHWILQGSADGILWDDLDEQTEQTFSQNEKKSYLNIGNSVIYLYYRLYFVEGSNSSYVDIGEWELFELEVNSVTNNIFGLCILNETENIWSII